MIVFTGLPLNDTLERISDESVFTFACMLEGSVSHMCDAGITAVQHEYSVRIIFQYEKLRNYAVSVI